MKVKVKKRQGKGRKRRLTGWTLIALGLLVAGVWGASGWSCITWESGGQSYLLMRGLFSVTDVEFGRVASFQPLEAGLRGIEWWCGWGEQDLMPVYYATEWRFGCVKLVEANGFAPRKTWDVLLWPIPLLLWAAGVPVLRSGILARRRANTNACAKCGYSLAGLAADAPCPECGKGKGTK